MTDRLTIIVDIVARAHRLQPAQLTFKTQKLEIARPRQMAMCIARKTTKLSLTYLGRRFASHHTTVLWAVRRCALLRQEQPEFAALYDACEAEVRTAFAGKFPHLPMRAATPGSEWMAIEAEAARATACAQRRRDWHRKQEMAA